MKRVAQTLVGASAIFLAGCAIGPSKMSDAEVRVEREEIGRRLTEILDAAEKKDLARLDSYHSYGPNFTKFAPEADARQDAEAAREGEHAGLNLISDLMMRPENLKVDVFGNVGIATFVMHYTFKAGNEAYDKRARTTMVFVKDSTGWKITHEHISSVRSGS